LDTTIRKQSHQTLIRHEPSYKQLEVESNRASCCTWKSQHRTQNVKTHNRRTQKTKQMSNTDLNEL
jgi:predicted acetyltransferase